MQSKVAFILTAGVVLVLGACDPSLLMGSEPAQDADAQPEGTQPAAPAETVDSCLSKCEGEESSEDDLATCRLLCKQGDAQAQAEAKHSTVAAYFACFDECAPQSPDDRATCQKNCAASVTAGSGNPADTACPRACVHSLGTCLAPCEELGSEDDRATCHKQCEVPANACVSACG